MKVDYTLTPKLRVFLKEPFGILIEGPPQETMRQLAVLVADQKPPRVITVGDVVTENMHKSGFSPQLSVIDYKSLRDQHMPKQPPVEKTVCVENPQGTITDAAEAAVKEALDAAVHTHVIVEGEEDLLTLVAVLYAPYDSFVVYGQPHVGIVIAKATKERKEKVKELLKEMKASKS